ncbi:MAG: outer membrane lipoprotein chaperone LolA [Pseudomonadota bacterium]
MKKNSLLTKIMISCALALPAMLSLPAAASGMDQFKSFVANTKSAKGEFSQQMVKMVDGQPKISKTSTGTFQFARPGKFIWSYVKPYEQLLQADGDKLYIYDKDLNQVTVKKLGNALGSSPAAILFGSSDLEKNFTLKEVGPKQGLEWFEAIPKTKDTSFDHIGIGMKDGVPAALELRDSFGQVSLITLKNVEKNPPMKADQFKFTVPTGADVFQQ